MTSEAEAPYPDLRDPRVLVAVRPERRPALAALWSLAERLTALLRDTSEPLIGQIKLAWWRDMLALLAADPAALPKGEPLLADLQANWSGQGGFDTLVDAAEALLLAEDADARASAAAAFGAALFGLSGGDPVSGRRWGLLWGAAQQKEEDDARRLFADARDAVPPPRTAFAGQRALLLLDRWAAAIAARGGERRWRSEGWLLFRLGLFAR